MSTKTLRKRIALVAVSALTAGLVSVVAVPSANAAASAIAYRTNGATGATAGTNGTDAKSAGLLGSVTGSGTTATATLLSSGALGIDYANGSSNKTVTVVTGGYISAAAATDNISADLTLAGADNAYGVLVKPNPGVTSFTVRTYDAVTATTAIDGGTLTGQIVVTVATTSVAGVYSAADSKVNTAVSGNSTVDGIDQNNATTLSPSVIPNGASGYINFTLKDAYGSALSAGAISITASAGGLVNASGTLGTATTPANSLAVLSDNDGTVTVSQAVANAPATVNVTISYNGTVVGTKTFQFLGEVAKVEAYRSQVATAGTSTADAYRVKYFDAAGNQLYPSNDTTNTTVVSTTLNRYITASTVPTTGVLSTATAAKGSVTCAGTASTGAGVGSAALQLQYVNASGTIVKSNTWTQLCGGTADSYTAKFDKASYKPGEVATLTITFKDAAGNLTHIGASNISSASNNISITGAPASAAITAPADADAAGLALLGDAAGTKTYQFIVGTTEGSYSALVSAPLVNTNGSGVKQTVAYSIVAGGVSNADVLKAIVSLIASINKQIAALQKALLKK